MHSGNGVWDVHIDMYVQMLTADTWLLIQDVQGDVEEPRPDLTADLIGQQTSFTDRHPPQSCHIHRTHTEGLRDVRHFPLPPAVPV